MGIVCWNIFDKNQTGHFISTRLQGESPFLVCCWRLTHLTLHHAHLTPLYPTWLWWKIQSTSKKICHPIFQIAIMLYFHRVDFAQPGHVLQVAAAVAYLKGVPLKQVDSRHARCWSQLHKFWICKLCTTGSFHYRCSWLICAIFRKSMVCPPLDRTENVMEKWIVDHKQIPSALLWTLACHFVGVSLYVVTVSEWLCTSAAASVMTPWRKKRKYSSWTITQRLAEICSSLAFEAPPSQHYQQKLTPPPVCAKGTPLSLVT